MKKHLFLLPLLTITLQSRAMDVQDEFFTAVLNQNSKKVSDLLKNPLVDVNKPTTPQFERVEAGTPALHIAARWGKGDVPTLKILLAAGANVNATDPEWGRTALFEAATPEVALFLLQHGIDPSIRDASGETAIESLAKTIKRDINNPIFGNIIFRKAQIKKTIEKYTKPEFSVKEVIEAEKQS